jgi:hypothetical protein
MLEFYRMTDDLKAKIAYWQFRSPQERLNEIWRLSCEQAGVDPDAAIGWAKAAVEVIDSPEQSQ